MIQVRMITPEGVYRTVESDIVSIDTQDGHRGILTNHMPTVLMLKIGQMALNQPEGRKTYTINGGMLYFDNNVATILSNAIEDTDDIDLNRAMSAKDRAEKRLQDRADTLDVMRAQLALARALNRIHAVNR